jgi:hypothetical protein
MGKVERRNPHGYFVRVSEDALVQLVLSGLEAYCIEHARGDGKRGSAVETYATLWGHQVRAGEDGPTVYCVEHVGVDTSADRGRWSVLPSGEALALKREVMASLWPQYDFLGDVHTHPFGHVSEVTPFETGFSDVDRQDIVGRSDYWQSQGYRVGLVLTIAWMKKGVVDPKAEILKPNILRLTLRNVRMWLTAYVVHSIRRTPADLGVTDEQVVLDCPALTGLNLHYQPMGKVATGRRRKYVPVDRG